MKKIFYFILMVVLTMAVPGISFGATDILQPTKNAQQFTNFKVTASSYVASYSYKGQNLKCWKVNKEGGTLKIESNANVSKITKVTLHVLFPTKTLKPSSGQSNLSMDFSSSPHPDFFIYTITNVNNKNLTVTNTSVSEYDDYYYYENGIDLLIWRIDVEYEAIPTYTATINVPKNGKLYFVNSVGSTTSQGTTKTGIKKGETVYFVGVAEGDWGNKLSNVTCTTKSGKSVTVKTEGTKTFSFVMPAENVTVTAKISYKIKVNQPNNGIINCSKDFALKGETVQLSIKPNTGYSLKSYTVKDTDGNNITVSSNGQFKMPEAGVTVTATLVRATYTATIIVPEPTDKVWFSFNTESDTEPAVLVKSYHYGDNPYFIAKEIDENYHLYGLTCTTASGKDVELFKGRYNTNWPDVFDFTMPAENVTITARVDKLMKISANPNPEAPSDYYTTFFCSDCNYTLPDGSTAYIGEVVGSELNLKETGTNVIPASTAVIIKADMTPITLIPTAENATVEKGDLLGYDKETSCESRSVYVLSALNGVMGFYLYKGTTLGAHKAFLPKSAVQANVNGLTFLFDEETDVEQIFIEPHTTNTAIYNISGQRLAQPTKGLNIIKGKKVFIK